jgi:hypothetical protein
MLPKMESGDHCGSLMSRDCQRYDSAQLVGVAQSLWMIGTMTKMKAANGNEMLSIAGYLGDQIKVQSRVAGGDCQNVHVQCTVDSLRCGRDKSRVERRG